MKRIQEYHIEYYWAEEAAKRKRRAKLKEKIGAVILLVTFLVFWGITVWESCNQFFEVIR